MVNEKTKNELAYIAGLFDSCGKISFLTKKEKITVIIQIYNNNIEIKTFLLKFFMFGKINKYKWSIKSNRGCIVFLTALNRYSKLCQNKNLLVLKLLNAKKTADKKNLLSEINLQT